MKMAKPSERDIAPAAATVLTDERIDRAIMKSALFDNAFPTHDALHDFARWIEREALSLAGKAVAAEAPAAAGLEGLTRYGWTEAYIGDTSELVEQADGTYVKFADVERLLATQAQAAAQATDLHNAIMNIPCKRADHEFMNTEHRMLYKNGHRDARHAAAELALAHPAAAVEPAVEQAEPLTNEAIDRLFSEMPGGVDGWLKQFGYRQFARAVARHVLVRVAVSMAGTIRPTDDELWEQTIGERDCYHEWADKLADAIAKHFGAAIGEHSNMNCPWAEALDVIQAAPAAPEQATPRGQRAAASVRKAYAELDLMGNIPPKLICASKE